MVILVKVRGVPPSKWLIAVPGVALCGLITGISVLLQDYEVRRLGHPYVEALVLAILLGMAIRSFWKPGRVCQVGIAFCAKTLLEIAVMLLGASLSLAAVAAAGPLLFGAVITIVAVALASSYGISRVLGLSNKMAILIACGNSICGNSAIAAVAPVIGASSDDVGSSISFTAILGVLTVLGLPLLIPIFHLSDSQYGILAGLTVYAVPQVLAATVPVGIVSTQIGTLVKLMRVLMLGPVVIGLSILARRIDHARDGAGIAVSLGRGAWMPWFIPGFILSAAARSIGLIPEAAIVPITQTAGFLTIVSMAALGLGVDLMLISRIGARVTMAVASSLAVLLLVSLALVSLL